MKGKWREGTANEWSDSSGREIIISHGVTIRKQERNRCWQEVTVGGREIEGWSLSILKESFESNFHFSNLEKFYLGKSTQGKEAWSFTWTQKMGCEHFHFALMKVKKMRVNAGTGRGWGVTLWIPLFWQNVLSFGYWCNFVNSKDPFQTSLF